jgi:hypothetical protein
MTLPRGYKPPKKEEIPANKDFGVKNNDTTNKKEDSLTNEILQSITIDDTINKVIDTGKEVVTNIEDTVKEVIEKGNDVISDDSSTLEKAIRYNDQSDKSQLTQENQMNKKNDYNYNANSNLVTSTDKPSTKEELTTTTIPKPTKELQQQNKKLLLEEKNMKIEDSTTFSNTLNKDNMYSPKSDIQTDTTKKSTLSEVNVKTDTNQKNQQISQIQKEDRREIEIAVERAFEDTQNNINKITEEARREISNTTERIREYQQDSINIITSIANNYISLQKELINSFSDSLEKRKNKNRSVSNPQMSWLYNYYSPERLAGIYGESINNFTNAMIRYSSLLNNFTLSNMNYFKSFLQQIELYSKAFQQSQKDKNYDK